MAVDFGDVRTGIAVSDESASLAGDAWVINEKREEVLTKTILDEAKARGVFLIVVGYPKNMDGSVGQRAVSCEVFARNLKNQSSLGQGSIEVALWDERLTTMQAERILKSAGKHGKKRKSSVDAVAASLILESYLDSRST